MGICGKVYCLRSAEHVHSSQNRNEVKYILQGVMNFYFLQLLSNWEARLWPMLDCSGSFLHTDIFFWQTTQFKAWSHHIFITKNILSFQAETKPRINPQHQWQSPWCPVAFAVVPFSKVPIQILHFPHRRTRGKLLCHFRNEIHCLTNNAGSLLAFWFSSHPHLSRILLI